MKKWLWLLWLYKKQQDKKKKRAAMRARQREQAAPDEVYLENDSIDVKPPGKPWHKKRWFICLLLVLFFPAGVALLWNSDEYSTKTKKIMTGVFAMVFICAMISGNHQKQEKQSRQPQDVSQEIADSAREEQIQPPPMKQEAPPPSAPAVRRDGPGPNGESIKGNISSKGEKIYHVPGSRWYDKTDPEAWFFTVDEAVKAGYRAPRQ